MPSLPALPFHLSRGHDVYGVRQTTSTTERINGLLRVDGDRLIVQWRIAREITIYGAEFRTDQEVEAVREATLPLGAISGAEVREHRFPWPWGLCLILRASDLIAFDDIAGAAGLRLPHPATLTLRIDRSDRLTAREFAADLNLLVAERAIDRQLPSAEAARLPSGA